jgi:hypothetical protein
MANIACQLPSIVDTTLFDYGRTLALWVSAFEILVHPGNGKANQVAVNKVLDKIPYVDRAMARKLFRAFDPQLRRKHQPHSRDPSTRKFIGPATTSYTANLSQGAAFGSNARSCT